MYSWLRCTFNMFCKFVMISVCILHNSGKEIYNYVWMRNEEWTVTVANIYMKIITKTNLHYGYKLARKTTYPVRERKREFFNIHYHHFIYLNGSRIQNFFCQHNRKQNFIERIIIKKCPLRNFIRKKCSNSLIRTTQHSHMTGKGKKFQTHYSFFFLRVVVWLHLHWG